MVQTGDAGSGQTIRTPSGALRSGRIVDARATNGSRGQGHTEGHLSVGGGCKSPFRVSGGTIETAIYNEESGIGKDDELTHGTGLKHVVVLLPSGTGSV